MMRSVWRICISLVLACGLAGCGYQVARTQDSPRTVTQAPRASAAENVVAETPSPDASRPTPQVAAPTGFTSPDETGSSTYSEPGTPFRQAAHQTTTVAKAIDGETLRKAIERSQRYLVNACDENGKFVYELDLANPQAPPSRRYNVLRHAGAMYSLAMIYQRNRDPQALAALRRAATLLRTRCLGPVPNEPTLLAVWSDPQLTGSHRPREAKLGGTGLGLVALSMLEKLAPKSVPREELRALGRFLIFMQKPDGSFHSKFYLDRGRDDSWTSLYYPGEAALGLLLLNEVDPQPKWRQAAADAMAYLARPEAWRKPVLPDHWMLLALERLLPIYDQVEARESADVLIAHARRTCVGMISEQTPNERDPVLRGCFGNDGRTTPTATRVEGLLAALQYLPSDQRGTPTQVRESAENGLRFLLRCQVREPPHSGAMPMANGPLPRFDRRSASFNPRVRTVRIDYVQHALCAMIQYERLVKQN